MQRQKLLKDKWNLSFHQRVFYFFVLALVLYVITNHIFNATSSIKSVYIFEYLRENNHPTDLSIPNSQSRTRTKCGWLRITNETRDTKNPNILWFLDWKYSFSTSFYIHMVSTEIKPFAYLINLSVFENWGFECDHYVTYHCEPYIQYIQIYCLRFSRNSGYFYMNTWWFI